MLTTITPYWGRPEALLTWLVAIRNAYVPEIHHILLFVGESVPTGLITNPNIKMIGCQVDKDHPRESIGFYHNMGAQLANTSWIMKLDIDAIPHAGYFKALLPVLRQAKEREWFNGGMFYINKAASVQLQRVLDEKHYIQILHDIKNCSSSRYMLPAATNFICRKADYLLLGGCDRGFKGYGWEDYQQIYMLERHFLGRDPLPGPITMGNVTIRCRDEISRPKAAELFVRNHKLALLHHWHPGSNDKHYKADAILDGNRVVLFDYIQRSRLSTKDSP